MPPPPPDPRPRSNRRSSQARAFERRARAIGCMQKKVSPHAALVRLSPPVEELSVTSEVDGRNLADLRLAPHEPRRCPLDPDVPTSRRPDVPPGAGVPMHPQPGLLLLVPSRSERFAGQQPGLGHSLLTNRIRVRGSGPHTGAWDRLLPLGGAGPDVFVSVKNPVVRPSSVVRRPSPGSCRRPV